MPQEASSLELPASRYREWAGPPQWSHVVLCRWEQRIGPGDRPYVQRVVPDGCADVIVGADGHALVVGPATGTVLPRLEPGEILQGLRFRSEATRAVLGVPASDLRDHTLAFDALLPARLARVLAGWLGDRQERDPSMVDAWLREAAVDPRVRAAARCLWNAPDRDVALVAEEVGVSGRQLRRLLLADLGLGPKFFQRVGRLQRFLTMADRAGASRSLADLAAGAGYADQAHLSREVLTLAGASPAQLLRERARAYRA